LKLEANDGKIEMDAKAFKTATIKTKRSKINKIAADPNVQSVSESHTYHKLPYTRGPTQERPEGRKLAEQSPYGIAMVQADQLSMGDDHVTICVIDTGYGEGHPDLPTSSEHGVDGFSPYGGSELWDRDVDAHGTHCAGTIGAIGGNGIGVDSVNPDPNSFTFYIGKGLTDAGTGSTFRILQAVDKCVEKGAKIISMSLGCSGNQCFSQTEAEAYEELYDEGILIIAAAGNDGNNQKSYPASYPAVMSVGAVNSQRNHWSSSQYNDQVEISAPGVSVLSTVTSNNGSNFGYASYSGTSMATPHVAGVAALVWSHFPQCSNNQIRNVLLKTAQARGPAGCDIEYGYGIVQAKAAYDLLSAEGCDAGGNDPAKLSNAAFGGCEQLSDYVEPPTPAPTAFDCDEVTVTIELSTDSYGEETSWTLTDFNNKVKASGSGYSSDTDYEIRQCVSADTCTFTIMDTQGDGICCGWGSGSYSVTHNGVKYNRNGKFGSSESITLCEEPATPAPTPEPVDCSTCDGTCIEMITKTDSNPEETRLRLKDTNKNQWVKERNYGDYSSPNTLYTDTMCVPDSCFMLMAQDKSKNGFGNGGYYSLVVDGETLVDQSSDFGKIEKTQFCTPLPAPTAAPVPAPVAPPTDPAPVAPPTDDGSGCSNCNGACIELVTKTDSSPEETRIRIKDASSKQWVLKGNYGDYSSANTLYTNTMCVPDSCFLLTAQDKSKNGFENGGYYSLVVDGVTLVDQSSDFGKIEKTEFCTPGTDTSPSPPVTAPTSAPGSCEDESSFQFKNKIRDCAWVKQKKSQRCKKFSEYCPATCGSC